jgi:hypothetical protein
LRAVEDGNIPVILRPVRHFDVVRVAARHRVWKYLAKEVRESAEAQQGGWVERINVDLCGTGTTVGIDLHRLEKHVLPEITGKPVVR